ncbi:hypothetical protein T4B_3120 [Trichinella pseudospiralis]|uniref:Uncharacterized protein n=1 Tax=Trichinella pseudospiralis TaxID=6337 RepID=A0A0V1JLL3_TRIPS|nr:hypothetical protein T4A_207 [Trichinella pseudospiralis]KRZ20513.1 hypothetical protein T4B_3120 [Trichinella pseudospiralis]KRZ35884.1 hypothetical protein T4C_12726 [Trichinella pseudospiralis]
MVIVDVQNAFSLSVNSIPSLPRAELTCYTIDCKEGQDFSIAHMQKAMIDFKLSAVSATPWLPMQPSTANDAWLQLCRENGFSANAKTVAQTNLPRLFLTSP